MSETTLTIRPERTGRVSKLFSACPKDYVEKQIISGKLSNIKRFSDSEKNFFSSFWPKGSGSVVNFSFYLLKGVWRRKNFVFNFFPFFF